VPRCVLILASDRVSRGERDDATAAQLAPVLAGAGLRLDEVLAVPDERAALAGALRKAAASAELVLTSGGTGIAPRDVTPEATRDVIEREIPGLGEAMRAVSLAKVPTAALSRATAGTLGGALILNLPGSPKGAAECLAAVLPAVQHGMKLLAGAVRDCQQELGGAKPRT
jgi:molybdenum cofactor synthesis domain-containing protein